jgi:hypothetical protein
MSKRLIGALIFTAAVAIAVAAALLGEGGRDPLTALLGGRAEPDVTVLAFIGGEKRDLVENKEVREILADEHGVILDARRAGSVELMTDRRLLQQKPGLLWPASQIAAELGKRQGLRVVKEEIVFSSPIVLLSWQPVAEALVGAGVAARLGNSGAVYTVDIAALLELIRAKRTWKQLGLDAIYGTVIVFSTDPRRSNSGNQFATLVATVLADGATDPQSIGRVIPATADIFRRMGYMEHSSSDLFEQYLRTGMTAKPLIAAYENQLLEFAAARPDLWKSLESQPIRPVILYPEPTMYASHVAIALTDDGRRAVDALKDPRVLAIAWQRHGFRGGLAGGVDAVAAPIAGIPATVPKVVPSPSIDTVDAILAAIDAR